MRLIRTCVVVLALSVVTAAQTVQNPGGSPPTPQPSAQSDNSTERVDDPNWLSPFVATPAVVVDAALQLAKVGKNDLVYDLGSGDGQIVLAAAQRFQARAVGIEWDQALCEKTSSAIRRLGLEDSVKVIQGDIFEQDLSPATVVTGYLMPKAWERLGPILKKQLKTGARVVSINDPIPGWTVIERKRLEGETKAYSWNLYFYRVP